VQETGLKQPVRAVLFDLDGTLVDSAPDLGGTANDLLARRGLPPLPLGLLRPHGGSGARGMLGVAFGVKPGDDGYEALREEFLDHYESRMLRHTQVFEAVAPVLAALEAQALPWGIVTNKALRFAQPVTAALALRPACLVGGDSTPHTKPHPAPLLEAARQLVVAAEHCIYVGDDARDMQAARAAGMAGWAAGWGYLGTQAPVHAWGASFVLQHPAELLHRLDLA
jgi:N-acetyl-D-muramate 6-phosphate phosphatase